MLARRRYGLAILALLCVQAPSFGQQTFWQGDLEAAKRLAAQTNRLVLIHFSAPWCEPCARLEKNVFSKSGFSAALDPQYVGVKLNFDEHRKLAGQYAVQAIPADVVITPQGQVVQKLQSPPTIENYVGVMQQVASRARGSATVAAAAAPPAAAPQTAATMPAAPQANSPTAPAGQAAKLSDDRYADYFSGLQASQSQAGNGQMAAASPPVQQTSMPGQPNRSMATATGGPQASYGSSIPATAPAMAGGMPSAPGTDQTMLATTAVARGELPHATWSQPTQPQEAANPRAANAHAPTRMRQLPPGSPPLGLEGYCPVTLVEKQSWKEGDVRFGAIHHGRTYLFASQAEQQRFLANPDAFSPVMSGDDPVLALDENKSVPGKRKHGVFYSNRIYLFSSEATLTAFSKNPGRYAPEITQARR
jgi:protein disulfide-isomerase